MKLYTEEKVITLIFSIHVLKIERILNLLYFKYKTQIYRSYKEDIQCTTLNEPVAWHRILYSQYFLVAIMRLSNEQTACTYAISSAQFPPDYMLFRRIDSEIGRNSNSISSLMSRLMR